MPADTWPVDTPVPTMLDRVRTRARQRRQHRHARRAAFAAVLTVVGVVAYGLDATSSSRVRTTPAGEGGSGETRGSGERDTASSDGDDRHDRGPATGKTSGGGARMTGSGKGSPAGAVPPPTVPPVTTNPDLTTTTTAPPPPQPAGSRDIAFVRGYRLWLVHADGRDPAPLTPNDPNHRVASPDWSPDGRRLAVYDWRNDGTGKAVGGLSIVELDGTMHRITPESTEHGSTEWSPDGTRIAYARAKPRIGWSVPEAEPYVVNADGSGDRRLTALTGDRVDWLSNDRLMGFCASGGLCTVDLDGSDARPIPNAEGMFDFAVSPDGRRFVYLAYAGDGFETGVMDVDGTDRKVLLRRWNLVGMSWSPDGRTIVFSGLPDSPPPPPDCNYSLDSVYDSCPDGETVKIWRMNDDGSDRRALTEGPGDYEPDWRPRQ